MTHNNHNALLLNADLGEGCEFDAKIMRCIDAASIACGGHTGDERTMTESVLQAKRQGVMIGAHPSYHDAANFGRISRIDQFSVAQIAQHVVDQVGALHKICQQLGASLSYIKPHGALYHDFAQHTALATAVFFAVDAIWPALYWMGLANSRGLDALNNLKAKTLPEAFIDRRYLDNGQLVPRAHTQRNPVIHTPAECVEQARLLSTGKVRSIGGHTVHLNAKTLCLHGDNEQALTIAQQVRLLMPKVR